VSVSEASVPKWDVLGLGLCPESDEIPAGGGEVAVAIMHGWHNSKPKLQGTAAKALKLHCPGRNHHIIIV
jgi:hypothetical protein